MKKVLVWVVWAVMTLGVFSCSQNRQLRRGLTRYAEVIRVSGDWVVRNGLIDPVKVATRSDGTLDRAKCIEAAKMLDVFQRGYPLMSSSLRQWARGEDVVVPPMPHKDYEAVCR